MSTKKKKRTIADSGDAATGGNAGSRKATDDAATGGSDGGPAVGGGKSAGSVKSLKAALFLAAVTFQIIALGVMIAKRVRLLETGKTALLKCVPIDPRSLFSGDYVILRFTVSRINIDRMKELNITGVDIKKNETVYVALDKAPNEKFHRAAAVAKDKKALAQWPLVLRGTALDNHRAERPSRLRLRYGSEEYFVPQYEGKEIERNIENAHVEIVVDDESGESAVKRLFIDDKEIKFY